MASEYDFVISEKDIGINVSQGRNGSKESIKKDSFSIQLVTLMQDTTAVAF